MLFLLSPSLMLPGTAIRALDPRSYEVGLGLMGVGKKPWKLAGFILKPGKITALEELHGNRSLPKSADPTWHGLKGEEGCSISVAKKNKGVSLRSRNKQRICGESKVVLSHCSLHFLSRAWQHIQRALNVKCINHTSLSLRFAVWNVVSLGKCPCSHWNDGGFHSL